MNDRAAAARKAACLVPGHNDADCQRRPDVRAPRDYRHLRGGPQGYGCRRARNDEYHRQDGGHRREEGQGDADKLRLVLLAVMRAHLPVMLEVWRPSLVQGLRHRCEVPSVAQCGAYQQGGGVLRQRAARLR
eukprot:5312524-Pleurochrysis_carterae.AAC.6